MNGLPYYKAYPRDFIEGTIGMPFEIKCAYRVVLDLIYMQAGNLPDDDRYISGLLGCSIRKWKSIRQHLIDADKIQVNGDFLTNYRAVSELETLAKLQDKQRENASRPRKNNNLQKPRRNHTEPEPESERDTNVSLIHQSDFDTFWKVCPRKVGKGAARKAYAAAVKKTDPQSLFSAMSRYAQEREGKDAQYTVHPATWLNQERWADEPQEQPTDFYRNFEAMLRGQDDGLQLTVQRHRGADEPVSSPVQAAGTHGQRGEDGAGAPDRGGDKSPYLSLIQPKRFGGSR